MRLGFIFAIAALFLAACGGGSDKAAMENYFFEAGAQIDNANIAVSEFQSSYQTAEDEAQLRELLQTMRTKVDAAADTLGSLAPAAGAGSYADYQQALKDLMGVYQEFARSDADSLVAHKLTIAQAAADSAATGGQAEVHTPRKAAAQAAIERLLMKYEQAAQAAAQRANEAHRKMMEEHNLQIPAPKRTQEQ